jgi:hypothetical protein
MLQVALPTDELVFPGQALHVELVEAPPAVEYVPAPQSVHTADPVDALYFPATHAVHGPPSGLDDPALQVQLVSAALPTCELEFDGQVMHVELAEAPTVVEYVPAPQSVQLLFIADLYLPATHAVHVPVLASPP